MEAVNGRVTSNSPKGENSARENARRRRGIGLLAMAAASAVCLQMSHRALGATETWTAGSGNWATTANWNSGAGPVPAAGDTVNITNDDSTSRIITYNYTGSAITLGSLTIDNDGLGTNTLSMTSSGTYLAAGNEYIGDSNSSTLPGWGVLIQSLGTNAVSNGLYLGYYGADDRGTYSLGGTGVLSAGSEYVGYNGTGSFTQSNNGYANSLAAGGSLVIGVEGAGVYTLSSGAIISSGTITEYVGYLGSGTFNQTGGYNVSGEAHAALFVGYSAGAAGTYDLSGGGLNIGTSTLGAYVGYAGSGTFTQSGGNANVSTSEGSGNNLSLGDQTGGQGVYNLSSGNLNVAGNEIVGNSGTGTFTQSGGTNTAGANLFLGFSSGSVGQYTLSAGSLSVASDESVAFGGAGTFTQSGGTNTVSGSLTIANNANGLYSLSGTGALSVAGNEYIGNGGGGSGTFNQSGGANTANGASESEYVGYTSNGCYIQTGGTNTASNGLNLGNSTGISGTYSLGGTGSLSAAVGEFVGSSGTGTFNQTGGTNAAGAALVLGEDVGTSGIYSLGGAGSLSTTGWEIVGFQGSGSFNQTGGTNTVSSYIILGQETGGSGLYTLSGGALAVTGAEYVGYWGSGTFTQTGGSNTASNNFSVGYFSGSSGQYTLSGTGVLNANSEDIGASGGSGSFTQNNNGYANSLAAAGALVIGDFEGVGVYTLNSGAITSSGAISEYVGYEGSGTFNQTGGYNIGGAASLTLYLGYTAGATGTYILSGGFLNVGSGGAYVGGWSLAAGGTGVLNVSGGLMTDYGTLEVWNTPGTHVTISGGSVSAENTVNLATINVTGGSANLGAITGTGTLNVGDASASVTASGLRQSSVTITSTGQLTLTAGGASNEVNSLVIDSGGVFDLTSTKLIVNYGSGSDPISTIAGYIKSGYNGGAWNGPGIISSAAQTKTNGLRYGIGYADSADPGKSK
ncbi:MAG: hypothetical protein ABSB42_07005 [Tepidisphaeraceae bacterium]